MALRAMQGPKAGLSAIQEVLSNFKAPWMTGDLKATAPLRIFYSGWSDIGDASFLSKATYAGWRYIIVSGGENGVPVATIDVDDRETPVEVGSIISGPMARGLLDASGVAEKVALDYHGNYEPRVLEVPSLYITALWLHGPKDVFIPIPDDVEKDRPRLDDAFVRHVLDAAQAHGQ